jgi:hypothetical protein
LLFLYSDYIIWLFLYSNYIIWLFLYSNYIIWLFLYSNYIIWLFLYSDYIIWLFLYNDYIIWLFLYSDYIILAFMIIFLIQWLTCGFWFPFAIFTISLFDYFEKLGNFITGRFCFVQCLSSSCVLCAQCCQCLWIVYSWLPLHVASVSGLSILDCPFVLPVSLDCPFFIAPSVFFNVDLLWYFYIVLKIIVHDNNALIDDAIHLWRNF